MSHKPSYDPSELSTGFEAEAWEAHAVRKAVEYDAYGSKTAFRVRVLSPPNNISKEDYQAVFGSDAVVVATGTDFKRYMFKGRIETEDGVPSPHRTLPDPCTIEASADPECTARIISWHTTFVSGDSVSGPRPVVGDIVKVTLAPGDLGKYNLQFATFNKVESQVANPGTSPNPACVTQLASLFNSAQTQQSPASPNAVTPPPPQSLGSATSELPPNDGAGVRVTLKNDKIVMGPAIKNFIIDLKKVITVQQIPHIVITSGIRTPVAQAVALVPKRAYNQPGNKCNSAISRAPTSTGNKTHKAPHAGKSNCYNLYALYRQKDLIMEVLGVPNTVAAMAEVLQKQVDRGRYLSSHMRDLGVDLRTKNLTKAQQALLIDACASLGASAIYEGDPPHIHVGIPASYRNGPKSVSNLANNRATLDGE